jgi:hypothetical protein
MKVSLSDAGVPFVVSYRKVLKKPKVERNRRFVGISRMTKNVLVKAIEFMESVAFETRTNVIEPGKSVAVHWAISVEDPFDTTTGREKNLIAYRMLDDMPPCGAHFEIISPLRETKHEVTDQEISPEDLGQEVSPERAEMLRRRREQRALLGTARGANGGFRRPPDPAYGPRAVRTLEEELQEEAQDEGAEDVGRTGGLGEDDARPVRSAAIDETGGRSGPDSTVTLQTRARGRPTRLPSHEG